MPEPVPHVVRRVALAWVLILACLAVVVARNATADAQRALAKLRAMPGSAPEQGLPSGAELQMRYLVGLHVLTPRAPLGDAIDGMVGEIAGSGTEGQRLALVPVLGELQGDEAAQARLVKLDREAPGFTAAGRKTLAALHALYPPPPAEAPPHAPAGSGTAVVTASATGVVAVPPTPAAVAVTPPGTRHADAATPVVTDPAATVLRALGWSGQLAVGHGDPGGPVEAKALATAVHLAHGMFVMILLGLGALACAVGFLVALVKGTMTWAYVPDTGRHPVWVEVFALYLAAFLGTGELLRARTWGSDDATLAATWLFLAVAPLLYGVLPLAGLDRAQIRAGLGWHGGSAGPGLAGPGLAGVAREIVAGFCGWLAGAPVVVLMAMLASVLSKRAGLDLHPDHPLVGEALAGHGWTHWLILASVASVFAPVVEETMFRGALFHHLRGWWSWPAAALLGGLVFAALHPQGLAAIPPLCAMAMVFTAIRTWRGTLLANMAAHACNNGMVLLVLWCVQS